MLRDADALYCMQHFVLNGGELAGEVEGGNCMVHSIVYILLRFYWLIAGFRRILLLYLIAILEVEWRRFIGL